jgi:hypothetical protein
MRRFHLMVAATLTSAVACGPDNSDGGLGALAGYHASVEFHVGPPNVLQPGERTLTFRMGTRQEATHAECASIRNATVRFNGERVQPMSAGGWNAGSTRTVFGEKLSWDHCLGIHIQVPFINRPGEPQNGTLEIEGEGLKFSVGFAQSMGDADLVLTSVRNDGFVVRPQALPVSPLTRDNFFVTLSRQGEPPSSPVDKFTFVDGELRVTLFTGGVYDKPTRGSYEVGARLGPGMITSCTGFKGCATATSTIFKRAFDLVIPFP